MRGGGGGGGPFGASIRGESLTLRLKGGGGGRLLDTRHIFESGRPQASLLSFGPLTLEKPCAPLKCTRGSF